MGIRGLATDRQFVSSISRNAPCPCGSGKKYKLCCLARDAAVPLPHSSPPDPEPSAQTRAQTTRTQAFGRLMAFAAKPAVPASVGAAFHEFWGPSSRNGTKTSKQKRWNAPKPRLAP